MRKLIWLGILTPLAVLCFMNVACGGYQGWPGLSTQGTDAKVFEEVSVLSADPLESGLWTYYVNYNNNNGPGMKTLSTFRDGTAPFAVFTTDGNGQQHFNDHVGSLTSTANDRDGDGQICWVGCPYGADYVIPDGFCPVNFGTGDPDSSDGFSAYCNKGHWEVLIASNFDTETKQSTPGSRFSNSVAGNFGPITRAAIIASSTPLPGGAGVTVSISGLSLASGASTTLATPVTANVYGFGNAIAINADQAGLKEAAGWLANQWAGQPDGSANVTVSFNGGAASGSFVVASGATAARSLQSYAGR